MGFVMKRWIFAALAVLVLAGCTPKEADTVSAPTTEVTTVAPTTEPPVIVPPLVLPPAGAQAVFFGDSYTNTSGELTGGIKSYAKLLSEENGWIETDKAFGGVGYQFFLEQVEQLRLVGPDIDIVFVLGGNNDIAKAHDEAWRQTVFDFYQRLREVAPNAMIYALSPMWGGLPVTYDMLVVREIIKEAADSTERACYVDLHDPLTGRSDLLVSDGMHPNAAGQLAIMNALLENMLPWPFCSSIGAES